MLVYTLIIFLSTPLYDWLIVHAQNEVGQELKEVLPQYEGHIKGKVAYIQLAALTREGHITDALESIEQVPAQASMEAGSRSTLIDVLFTP